MIPGPRIYPGTMPGTVRIMRVLVTGGLGHIGSALIRSSQLHSLASHVAVVDNISSERFCSLFGLGSETPVRFQRRSVHDLGPLDLVGYDAVIHLAAQTDASASLDQRDAVFQNNLEGTRRIVELASISKCRLIFASTTSVYGSQDSRVDEECGGLSPQSPYAECKLEEEELIRAASRNGLEVVILRLGTIAGPSPGMRFHTAVNKFCLQARLGEPLSVWRTAWDQVRPYLDVDDAVRALAWATEVELPADFRSDPILNVVSENLSVQEVVMAVETAFGGITVEFTDSRIMNQLTYEVCADKIARMGLSPRGSISGAIDRTAALLTNISN